VAGSPWVVIRNIPTNHTEAFIPLQTGKERNARCSLQNKITRRRQSRKIFKSMRAVLPNAWAYKRARTRCQESKNFNQRLPALLSNNCLLEFHSFLVNTQLQTTSTSRRQATWRMHLPGHMHAQTDNQKLYCLQSHLLEWQWHKILPLTAVMK